MGIIMHSEIKVGDKVKIRNDHYKNLTYGKHYYVMEKNSRLCIKADNGSLCDVDYAFEIVEQKSKRPLSFRFVVSAAATLTDSETTLTADKIYTSKEEILKLVGELLESL